MVKENRINLVEEFRKTQKNNDFIILTTFTFDPVFFDNFLFRELRNNNPLSKIIVLVDSGQYEKSYENFTRSTGNLYNLIPIFVNNGVFHPKIFIFISKEKICYYLGSSNLTLQGFTKNAELISKTEYMYNQCLSDIQEVIEIIEGLNREFVYGSLSKTFDLVVEKYLPSEFSKNNDFNIFHNLNEPILDQLINELKIYEFDEIDILAPFFSQEPQILSKLVKNLKIGKINILLQNNNHNLQHPQKYLDFAKKNNIILEFKKAEFEDKNRVFHSKIVSFKGNTNFFLSGSPNFTISALLNDANHGNIEFCILYQNLNPDEILGAIKTKPIIDIKEINPELPKIEVFHGIKILSVDYDEIKRELHIIMFPVKKEAKIIVVLANGKTIDYTKYLDTEEYYISIPYSYPIEIEIEINGLKTKRRIFYDEKQIYRGGSYSYKDLDKKLYTDPIIDINDILAIIAGISHQKPEKNISNDTKSNKKIEKQVLPSSINKQDAISIIRDLNRIERFIEYRTRLNIEEYSQDESQLKPHSISYNLVDKKAEEILIRIIQMSNKILVNSTERLDEESEENWKIRSQSIFINLISPIIMRSIELEPAINKFAIFEEIKTILEEEVKSINKEYCSKDTLSQFFTRILLLNYYFYDNKREQDTYRFLSSIFNYQDLINKNAFTESQKHVKKVIIDLKLLFTCETFIENFVNLMEYVFSSSTIDEGLGYCINQIKTEKSEYQFVIRSLIEKIIGKNERSRFGFSNENKTYIKAIKLLNETS